MDPITGISLAASVVQLVTFGIETVKTCRELYKQGCVSEYRDLEYTTGHLASLTDSLRQSLLASGPKSLVLTREEKDLVDLGRKCEDCAHDLQRELRKLQSQPGASALVVVQKAARVVWKRDRIIIIQERLVNYRSTLEVKLLHQLSQRFNAELLKSDKSFASLDISLQHIITCLANSQTSLATLVAQGSEQTRHHITAQTDRLERLHIDDRLYEEVTKSLFYPDIFSRQEQVDNVFDGIENTYDWIFDEPRTRSTDTHDQPRWDDFACWLKSGHGVYWINGKAGSGKSTLMNHICDHDRRMQLLEEWCPNKRLLTPTFFFWNAGTSQQKTINGLLRSLVYQMLSQCRELIACFNDEPLHAWSETRLQATLLKLLRQTQIPIAICMFIDGLDEFEGRYENIIGMIQNLADQNHIKICLSSRPLLAFEEAFNGKPGLRLQDLTFDSIRDYADLKLSGLIQQHVSYDENDRARAGYLLTRIVHRANGVILWAVIAIREVRDGLQDIVNMNELARAIEILPAELEDLYMLMLNRIKPACQRDAAHFIRLVIHDELEFAVLDLSRLHFTTLQRTIEDSPFYSEEITTNKLIEACHILRTRLLSHTGGFLELTPSKRKKLKEAEKILLTRVNFHHKSARDFLVNNDKAKAFLALDRSSASQICLTIARGTLTQLAHFSREDAGVVDVYNSSEEFRYFRMALQQVSMAERFVGAAQSKLMQSLNYESFVRRYPHGGSGDEAFLVTGMVPGPIDIVGMAASLDMFLYPCAKLGLSINSRSYSPVLPDLKNYSKNRTTTSKNLVWSGLNDSQGLGIDVASRLRSSNYRQALHECLQREAVDPFDLPAGASPESIPLAESYLLSCCSPRNSDLVRTLLRAGANPMVIVKSMKTRSRVSQSTSFWESWLDFLLEHRHRYMLANGRSGALLFDDHDIDLHTMSNIVDITRALLTHGADINYQMERANSQNYKCYLKRLDMAERPFDLIVAASAMFTLEECFSKEPEFRKFFDAVKPLVETPTRKIIYIHRSHRLSSDEIRILSRVDRNVCPSIEECEVLWPLVERWESTGHCRDLNTLQSAMEKICQAHNPQLSITAEGS